MCHDTPLLPVCWSLQKFNPAEAPSSSDLCLSWQTVPRFVHKIPLAPVTLMGLLGIYGYNTRIE